MGWSFRKSIKLGKGTRLNLSKSGIGLSTGVKGLRISKGPRGSRITAGIPGTGIYYSKNIRKHKSSSKESSSGFTFYFIILLFLLLVVFKQIMLFLILTICFIGISYIKWISSKENNQIEDSDTNNESISKDLSQEEFDEVNSVFYEKGEFYFKNLNKINKYEHSLVNESQAMYNLAKENIELAIVQGKEFLKVVNDFENFCKISGEKGIEYFEKMWNSDTEAKKSFIKIRKEFLENLIENKVELQEKINLKKKKELLLKNIDEKILQEIKGNNGILQKDLFLLFDPDIKHGIAKHLIAMEKNGQIKRIKHGNTYQLYIN